MQKNNTHIQVRTHTHFKIGQEQQKEKFVSLNKQFCEMETIFFVCVCNIVWFRYVRPKSQSGQRALSFRFGVCTHVLSLFFFIQFFFWFCINLNKWFKAFVFCNQLNNALNEAETVQTNRTQTHKMKKKSYFLFIVVCIFGKCSNWEPTQINRIAKQIANTVALWTYIA